MQEILIEKIYKETVRYCKDIGLLTMLNKSLSVSEVDRFTKKNIDKYGLDVLDAVHCLVDDGRTRMLLNEVAIQCADRKNILEAGIGTGILSFVASIFAENVYGVEINNSIYLLANDIKKHLIGLGLIKNNIFFIEADAKKVKFDINFEVIISENLYTGMFFEKQVEIINSIKSILKEGGTFIPSGLISSFCLSNSNLGNNFFGNRLHIISEMNKTPIELSDYSVYDNLDFKNNIRSGINYHDEVIVNNDGIVDSLMICSDVMLKSGNIIGRYDTTFMNNDIMIRLDKNLLVKKGNKVSIDIIYEYGSDPNISVIKASIL